MSFGSKSDFSLLHALQTTLFLRLFRINLESLISDYLTVFPERLEKLNYLSIKDHGLVKIYLVNFGRVDHQNCRNNKLIGLPYFA